VFGRGGPGDAAFENGFPTDLNPRDQPGGAGDAGDKLARTPVPGGTVDLMTIRSVSSHPSTSSIERTSALPFAYLGVGVHTMATPQPLTSACVAVSVALS
jgi:hypothetical protein